ncbi:MAG: CBS domain-containing protein [Saprospiraceae bacterium]
MQSVLYLYRKQETMRPELNDKISEIMTVQPMTVQVHEPLQKVYELMNKLCIRHIPVEEDTVLKGMISKSDLDKWQYLYSTNSNLSTPLTAKEVMTKSLHTIQHDDTIKDAAEMLSLASFHALPVMQDEKLAGIVTSTDLIIYLLKDHK